MEGRKLSGSLELSTNYYPTFQCWYNSCVEIFEGTKKHTSCVKGVLVCMGLYLLIKNWWANKTDVTAAHGIEGLVVHVAMQSVRCNACSPTDGSALRFSSLAPWLRSKVIHPLR